ncbi:MAG: hypothetical protein RLZZ26_182 [Candidatus Parcubacteria bacterium]|jgi:hypothetical protein
MFMSNEEQKLSSAKTEKKEGAAAPEQGADGPNSPEQVIGESQKEVESFVREGGAQLAVLEARAGVAGAEIDPQDKDSLSKLVGDATTIQDQLLLDLGPDPSTELSAERIAQASADLPQAAERFLNDLHNIRGLREARRSRTEEVCLNFLRPYQETPGLLRALLSDGQTAPTALQTLRAFYLYYKDDVDPREWESRTPGNEDPQDFLAAEIVASLEAFDSELGRDDLDKESMIKLQNNIFYTASEALDTRWDPQEIEKWLTTHTQNISKLDPTYTDAEGVTDTTPFRTWQNIITRTGSLTGDPATTKLLLESLRSNPNQEEVMDEALLPILERIDPKNHRLFQKKELVAEDVAGRLGLDPEIVQKWKESRIAIFSNPEGPPLSKESYGLNIRTALYLERRKPGVAKQLFDDFGIANFARYDEEMLLRQAEMSEVSTPYGVIIYPEADWNGAFFNTMAPLARAAEQLRGGGIETRIIEAGSQKELARCLLSLDKRYAPDGHKISFAIIGGHGSEHSIALGNTADIPPPLPDEQEGDLIKRHPRDSGTFTTSDILSGKGIRRGARELFVDKAPVVLVSCSTGVAGGIGETASAAVDWDITGPDRPTNVDKINVTFRKPGEPSFEVVYKNEAKTGHFRAGREV